MTQLFQAPHSTESRSRFALATTVLCVAIIAVAAVFTRKTGACGTGHYVFFQLLGGMLVSVVEEVWQSQYDRLIANALAYVLNVGVFVLLIRAWYRKASSGRYIIGAIGLTAVYLISYFYLLPTVDCP
jgi:hypothetical protein